MPPASDHTSGSSRCARATATYAARSSCATGFADSRNAFAPAATPESRRTTGRASCGSSAPRHGGALATTADPSSAGTGSAAGSPARHAHSQLDARPWPADLSRPHSSRPAGHARTRCRRRPSRLQAAARERFAGRAPCIPLRLCAPSRPRRSPPSSSGVIKPNRADAIAIAIRNRKRVGCECRRAAASKRPRHRPSIARSRSPRASPSKSFPRSWASKPIW